MQAISTMTTDLQWVKPSWRKNIYELHDGSAVVASLAIGGWRNDATGETAQGAYQLKRAGFWRQRMVVTEPTSGVQIAEYVSHWSGSHGDLTMANGAVFHRAQRGFWQSATEWTDAQGQWLCRVTGNWKNQIHVVLNPEAPTYPELGLLLLLTHYLMTMAAVESAAAAATTVSTGG